MDPLTAIGAVASVCQLAQAALSLSKSLYALGSAVSSASEDIQMLADDLRTFSQSLTLLSRLLEDGKCWYSDDIYLLTAKIIKDCAELYVKIDKILVKLRGNGKSNWKLRMKFVYKEGQIRKLLSRLRDMKGTLATILLSLQVDLQLSLLNISSPSNFQRSPEKALQPDTINCLKLAREAVEAGSFLPKYASNAEKDKTPSFGVANEKIQQPHIVDGSLSSFTMSQFTIPVSATALCTQQLTTNLLQSFVMVPSEPHRTTSTSLRSSVSVESFKSALTVQPPSIGNGPSNLFGGIVADRTEASTPIIVPAQQEHQQYGHSLPQFPPSHVQCADLEIARNMRGIQGIMHAFQVALEIIETLIPRRQIPANTRFYTAARNLKQSLDEWRRKIARKHVENHKKLGEPYLHEFKSAHLSKLKGFNSMLTKCIIIKLHEYTTEDEVPAPSNFDALRSLLDQCSCQILEYLDRISREVSFEIRVSCPVSEQTFTNPVSRNSTTAVAAECHNFGIFEDCMRLDDPSGSALSPGPDFISEPKDEQRVSNVSGAQRPLGSHCPSDPTRQLVNTPELSLPFIGYTFKRFDKFNSASDHVPKFCSSLAQQEPKTPAVAGLISEGETPPCALEQNTENFSRANSLGQDFYIVPTTASIDCKTSSLAGSVSGGSDKDVWETGPLNLGTRIGAWAFSQSADEISLLSMTGLFAKEGDLSRPFDLSLGSYPMIQNYTEQEMSWKYPTLAASQETKVWWQAYLSLAAKSSSPSKTFNILKHEFDVELDLPSAYRILDKDLALRVSLYLRQLMLLDDDNKPVSCMQDLLDMRKNAIRIVQTVDEHLGLEVATLGWSFVWVFIAIHEPLFLIRTASPSVLYFATKAFTHLQTIVALIARYAVMENLRQHSNCALSIEPAYRSCLISLCSLILEWFAASFVLGRQLTKYSKVGEDDSSLVNKIQKCDELMGKIKLKDQQCRGFRLVVEAGDGVNSKEDEVGDMSDDSWDETNFVELEVYAS